VIEFALHQKESAKTESLLKTWLHAVILAVWDVREVTLLLLGNGGKKLVLLLETYSETPKNCQPYSLPPCDHHTTGKYNPCPAVVPTPDCSNECQDSYPTPYKKDKHMASDAYNVDSDVRAIQTEIMTYGPVEAAFSVYEDFLAYKSGVYQHVSGSMLGGHAVKILGWGTEDGTDYWLVANSWNEDWGAMGYFKIRRGTDECGIEDEITAGTPTL